VSRRALLAVAVAATIAAACGDDDDGGESGGGDGGGALFDARGGVVDAAPPACWRRGTDLSLELVESGFSQPIFVTAPPDDARLFVVEQDGLIKVIEDGHALAAPFLDIRDRVVAGGEQGLLGMAFHPDYATTGRFFVYYTAVESEAAGPEANVVAQYLVSAVDANLADPDSEERVIEIADFAPNHNSGMLAFGRDGYLYFGTGDGGEGSDPNNNGQDRTTILGDLLRIDVDGGNPYAIPVDNPYVGSPGGAREEIWISGLRNPWRWSFDRETGDMYIGDVGQGRWEEINVLPAGQAAGANLGWDEMEGDECFNDKVTAGDPGADPDCDPGQFTRPVVTEFHDRVIDEGHRAIVGGYVYRGTCYPDIRGWYFYADYRESKIWKLVYAAGEATAHTEVTGDLDPQGTKIETPASFGEDAGGELYVVMRQRGELYRIAVDLP
jgi:glucose/arabinose dehydrogenase